MTKQKKRDVTPMLEFALDPDLEDQRYWQPPELADLLQHQWDAPLEADLGELPPGRARLLKRLCEAEHLLLKSYGELFSHPLPPIEVLEMIKDYAKRHLARPNLELPEEMAMVLYVLSVVVARLRCGKRITSQSDEAVRKNIETMLSEPWITDSVAMLLREGLAVFGGEANSSDINHGEA